MKKDPFFTERRMSFFPNEAGLHVVVGGRDKEAILMRKAKWLKWGESVPESEWMDVRYLRLDPGIRQAKTFELPAWVSELGALEYLDIPFPFVAKLDPDRLPASLRCLQIGFDGGRFGSVDASAVRWPDISLPSLERLAFVGSGHAHWTSLGIGREHVPGLLSLRADLGEDDAALPALERLGPFEVGELYVAGNLDLFGSLPSSIRYLFLNSTKRKFDASAISRLRKLRSLMLVAVHSPFDLAWLENLGHLIELEMWGVKQLRNVEALLHLRALRRLVVVGCGKPFDKELQAKLAKVGYEELGIRNA